MASSAKNPIWYNDAISHHNTKNSDDDRKVKQVIKEHEQNQFKNTLHQKVQRIAKDLQIHISDVTSTSKSKWKKKVKGEAIDRIRKRMKEGMQEKTKCCTLQNANGKGNNISKSVKVISIKDVIKIRLHMWNTECNYTTCPLCKTEEDTTELIMVDQEGNNTYNLLDENEKNSCNKISTRTGKK